MSTRRCYRCEERKPLDAFARDASKGSGFKSLCKGCDNAKSRRYYEANRERVLARLTKSQKAAVGAELLPMFEAEARERMLAGKADPSVELREGRSDARAAAIGPTEETPAPASVESEAGVDEPQGRRYRRPHARPRPADRRGRRRARPESSRSGDGSLKV